MQEESKYKQYFSFSSSSIFSNLTFQQLLLPIQPISPLQLPSFPLSLTSHNNNNSRSSLLLLTSSQNTKLRFLVSKAYPSLFVSMHFEDTFRGYEDFQHTKIGSTTPFSYTLELPPLPAGTKIIIVSTLQLRNSRKSA